MKISIAMLISAALVITASLSAIAAAAAAAPAARMGGAGGGPTGLCVGSGTSARAICSLCDSNRFGRLYDACCSQRRAFELCAEAVAAAGAAAAAPPRPPKHYVGGGIQLQSLPSGDAGEAGWYATSARADKRYGRMGFGRAAPPPPPRTPRENSHQSAKRADDEAASWSVEQSDVEEAAAAAAAPQYDGSDDSYYYDYRDEAGGEDHGDVDVAAGVGYEQLGDSLLEFLGGGNEKRFGNLGMRGGR